MLQTFNFFLYSAAVFCGEFSLIFHRSFLSFFIWGWERWCDLSQVTDLLEAQTEFEPRSAWLHLSWLEDFWEAVRLAASLDRRADGRPEMAYASSQRKGSPGVEGCRFSLETVWTLQHHLGHVTGSSRALLWSLEEVWGVTFSAYYLT